MKPEEFSKHFATLCEQARTRAFQDKEQVHVLSAMIDNKRVLALIPMRELPSWLESHFRDSPQILYSSPASIR